MLQTVQVALIEQGDNPRKLRDKEDDARLKASIEAHGLLQPLLVAFHAEQDVYRLIAGNRRLEAVKALGWTEIDCNVIQPADDTAEAELALVENVIRADMSDVDQFEAFGKLVSGGMTPADIAAHFTLDIERVHRILALGSLHPDCLAAWRKGKIDTAYAQALTIAGRDRQPKLMKQHKSAWQLKQALTDKKVTMEHARFTREEYEAAGGEFTRDLFSDVWNDGEREFAPTEYADPEIFWRLQDQWIEAEAERLRKEGWGEVVIREGQRYSDQVWSLHDRPKKAVKAKRIALIRKLPDGEVIVHRNCAANKKDYERILNEGSKPKSQAGSLSPADPESDGETVAGKPSLSGAVIRDLALVGSAELVHMLSECMNAHKAMAAWMALALSRDIRLLAELGDIASGMQDKFAHPFTELMDQLQALCGKWEGRGYYLKHRRQAKVIYETLLEKKSGEVLALFSALLGLTVHWNPSGKPHPFGAALGEALEVDPLAHFTFDSTFWARTTKAYMVSVAEEVACKGWAESLTKMKAKDAAAMMGALFGGPSIYAKKIKEGNYSGSQDLSEDEIVKRIEGWRPEGFGRMAYDSNEDTAFDLDDPSGEDDGEFEDDGGMEGEEAA